MDLSPRVCKLEDFAQDSRERLLRIEMRIEHIDEKLLRIDHRLNTEMATKDFVRATVMEAKNSIIMWVVSAILLAQLLPALLKKFGL